MENTIKNTIKSRKVAILAADGVNGKSLNTVKKAIEAEGAIAEIIAPRLNVITADDGSQLPVDQSLLGAASVLFDAVYIPGGEKSVSILSGNADALHFVNEAYKHCKAIALDSDAQPFLEMSSIAKKLTDKDNTDSKKADPGLIIGEKGQEIAKSFIEAIGKHRFWDREQQRKIPA